MLPSLSNLFEKLLAYAIFFEISAMQIWMGSMILGIYLSMEHAQASISLLQRAEVFLGTFLILCYVMAINDYFDLEIDKLKIQFTRNYEKGLLSRKGRILGDKISIKESKILIPFMLILGSTLSWLASQYAFLVMLLIILLGTFYSAPPIRYKQIYPLSTLGDIAGGTLPFLVGYAVVSPINFDAVVVSIIPSLVCAYHRLKHEALMYEFDRSTGKKTIAVVNGIETASILRRATLVLILFVILMIYLLGWFSITSWFIFFLFFFLAFGLWSVFLPKTARKIFGALWSFIYAIFILIIL